jgi:RimJ/RimL family protein N-acetyltransferase
MSDNGRFGGDVFIAGETIDLCVPQESDLAVWTSWFNNPRVTKLLAQGQYPHSIEQQAEFLRGLRKGDRFAVMIRRKSDRKLLGTISLSKINMSDRSAQISLVVPTIPRDAPLASLEAMALVSQHGFEKLGLDRIYAGQAFPSLIGWNQRLEIIGYKTDGLLRRAFVKGRLVSDVARISLIVDDYLELCKRRGGDLWPGDKKARAMIKLMPEADKSLAQEVAQAVSALQDASWRALASIETKCSN